MFWTTFRSFELITQRFYILYLEYLSHSTFFAELVGRVACILLLSVGFMYYIEVILIWIVGGDKTCLPSTSYESVYIQLYFLHLLLRIYYEF